MKLVIKRKRNRVHVTVKGCSGNIDAWIDFRASALCITCDGDYEAIEIPASLRMNPVNISGRTVQVG